MLETRTNAGAAKPYDDRLLYMLVIDEEAS